MQPLAARRAAPPLMRAAERWEQRQAHCWARRLAACLRQCFVALLFQKLWLPAAEPLHQSPRSWSLRYLLQRHPMQVSVRCDWQCFPIVL